MFWKPLRLRPIRFLLLSTILSVVFIVLRGLTFERHHNQTALNKSFQPGENGFIGLAEAAVYCHQYQWRPYPKRDVRRKVYDLFLFNGELDWLEIRLNEIHNQVDFFVIVESETTFTGIPKLLHIKEHWELLKPFHDKIIYHVLEKSPEFHSTITWDHEDLQRNSMFDQVFPHLEGEKKPELGDVILVSDVDEVPRPSSLEVLRNCDYNRRVTLRSHFYYYAFQWQHRGDQWQHPQATYYQGSDTIRPANLRNGEGGNALMRKFEKRELRDAAWHCSNCFATLEEMLNKMSSFSHTKLNTPKFRERAGIVTRVRNGLDLFDRPKEIYDRLENNEDLPAYLKENREKFGYLIDRDPLDANFRDYKPEADGEKYRSQNRAQT